MIRPAPARLAACLVTGLVTSITGVGPAPATASAAVPEAVAGGVAAAQVAAAAPRTGTPLQVSIESLTPSTIPRRGEVTVTGEITNRSRDEWTDLNAYLLTSSQPITTAAELEAATETAEDLQVGERRGELPGAHRHRNSLHGCSGGLLQGEGARDGL